MQNNIRYLSDVSKELYEVLYRFESITPMAPNLKAEIKVLNAMIVTCTQLILLERCRIEIYANSIADCKAREIFYLSAINGLSINEISALLGLDASST